MSKQKCDSDSHDHSCHCTNQTAAQSFDELEFERGVWSAAQYGELSKVKKLVDCGKNEVDQRDRAGYTALHYAARNGHLEVCEYLVMNGAQIDAVTKAGRATALHRACSAGKTHIVNFLLSKKAQVTLQDSDGKTALHRASENGHVGLSKILLRYYPELAAIPDSKGLKPRITDIGELCFTFVSR